MDYVDYGDSYNNGPKADDKGYRFKVLRSKAILKGKKWVEKESPNTKFYHLAPQCEIRKE